MNNALSLASPPDQAQRKRALEASRSILVEAPAGSGKTDLLTRRFLRLLAEVEEPGRIIAITFTKAAAAEMRHRIIAELENAVARGVTAEAGVDHGDEFSMEALARRALERSQALGWNLVELPAQLRILTIDAFCRELALAQPLLVGLGGGLEIAGQPADLYRRAARRTLEHIDSADPELRGAIEALLLWRDNNWQEMEELLVQMLCQRDRWMHGFVLEREQDWEALRERLERPFARAVSAKIAALSAILDQAPHALEEAFDLARFACTQSAGALHRELAEMAEFPARPFDSAESLDEVREACACLAALLLTNDGEFRKQVNISHGFPKEGKAEKKRLLQLIADLEAIPGLKAALAGTRSLPPARYTDEDWRIVRACFALLRHAAAELKVVFAEAAVVDYIEVAQIAHQTLRNEDGFPGDAALAFADGIRHILVDEFQDTSRRQHELLRRLIAAWTEREGRTCFVVGDPMQSIYFFRDADAELFSRVKTKGLEILHEEPLLFDQTGLRANFRTAPALVAELNEIFERIFAEDDGSRVVFGRAEAARVVADSHANQVAAAGSLRLHLEFMPQVKRVNSTNPDANPVQEEIRKQREAALTAQTEEVVELIRGHTSRIEQARAEGAKYRVAVLGRTRAALIIVAQALREAAIPFRAVELERLAERPEILDALALARALLNPYDRVAWLGLLRAPWCGLSLTDLHTLASADNEELMARPLPDLLAERTAMLSEEGKQAAQRVLRAISSAGAQRFAQPAETLGTWLEQAWLRLGGAYCVDAGARANLDLFWRCLDRLPNGEQDLLGPALDGALEALTAWPDPGAGSDCGIQLMTIHKAKGLEFEVVIVPELQAQPGRGAKKLLSWLERGLAAPDDSDEPTEFLVAPLQSKGADRGKAKEWVDRECREREKQESRRILYVAATRAREELHLFARPAYKTEADGSLALVEPRESLLATAWPAFEFEIRERFDQWRASKASDTASHHESATIAAIAASGSDNLLVMPPAAKPALLRRLPPDFEIPFDRTSPEDAVIIGENAGRLYPRHEGGLHSRALGIAVHTLLQELAALRETQAWEAARAALSRLEPRLVAQVRAAGLDLSQARRIAEQAVEIAIKATRDPMGEWIFSPHADAASEARWAGVVDGSLRTVQVDRVFRAGPEPHAEGDTAWWIIDYKTAHADSLDPDIALPELRHSFAPQIEAYAAVLRNLQGEDAQIRGGLYYPRMMQFDWWAIES